MISAFDRIVIEVPDLDQATAEYSELLGPFQCSHQCALLTLGNITIELQHNGALDSPRIAALALLDSSLDSTAEEVIDSGQRKLLLLRSHTRQAAYHETPTATGIYAVDHLVLQTRDADDCIRLFRDELGLRLALDQYVPEWGGRMLFFRMGKMTLEVIQNLKQAPAEDFFWGITFLCRDLEKTAGTLDERAVTLSPTRDGRKPGTRVTTVKSHCLGLPTLLIGPEKSDEINDRN